MKKLTAKVVLLFLAITLLNVNVSSGEQENKNKDGFFKWYQDYPWMQEFYPFGTYGEKIGSGMMFNDGYLQSRMSQDAFSRNNMNFLWTTGPAAYRHIWNEQGQTQSFPNKYKPELNDFGKWFYGVNTKEHEMKVMPGFAEWTRYNQETFTKQFPKMKRNFPVLTNDEKGELGNFLKDVFGYGRNLRKDYPETVVGFISDDEPSEVAPSAAAYELIEKNTGAPAMTCSPTFPGVKLLAPNMRAITGDWYLNSDNSSNNWDMAPQIRWMNNNFPDNVFWVMLWLCGSPLECNEETLPGLRDSRGSRAEIRLQAWQAVALGVKGVTAFVPGGSLPGYLGGYTGLYDILFQKDPVNGHLDEWNELGAVFTTQGPLLLSCRADESFEIKIACSTVRYPEFEGPAIDYGLLKDIKNNRYFLIPWNNDVDKVQSAKIAIPASLLKDRNVYELDKLVKIDLAGGELSVSLPPGGGRIYLLAPEDEFNKCREVVLKNKTRTPRLILRQDYELAKLFGGKLEDLDKILTQIAGAEKQNEWAKALELYPSAQKAMDVSLDGIRLFKPVKNNFNNLASILSETNLLYVDFMDLLELPYMSNSPNLACHNKYVGEGVREWTELSSRYFSMLKDFYEKASGEQPESGKRGQLENLNMRLPAIIKQAERNRDELKKIIEKRLEEVRIPEKIALITPDRKTPEYVLVYSWAFKNSHIKWFAPDNKGILVDMDGKTFKTDEFNVVWIHQLRYLEKSEKPGESDIAKLLMPQVMTPEFKAGISKFTENGGGLLLTGIAGLYAFPLGIEKVMPNILNEKCKIAGRGVGVVPAPGCKKHPAFTGFEELGFPDGFFTNGGGMSTSLAWENSPPNGSVIANLMDASYGQMDNYAVAVEYSIGKGKVAVFDGNSLAQVPIFNHFLPKNETEMKRDDIRSLKFNSLFGLRGRVRKFTLNMLAYLGSSNSFKPDTAELAAKKEKLKVENEKRANNPELPKDAWIFKLDPKNAGESEKWFASELNTSDWKPIQIGLSWEAQGYDYDGYAWYRVKFKAANRPGKKVLLRFGAVDEKAFVYMDGKKLGESHGDWEKPFEFDISSLITDKEEEHLLAVKVYDLMAAGGIWKSVWLSYENKEQGK